MATKLKSAVRNKTPADLLNDEVDLTISKMVVINADIQFKHLLRIDGRFEGKLIPNVGANVIVTQRGHYLGDIIGLDLAYVDGKVEGDIFVNALELGPHANVCGNILCKRIVIAGHAKFSGELNVTPSNIIPPPPAPPTSALTTEPETVDEQDDSDVAKELHLVEDDEMACAVPPRIIDETAEGDSSELHESFSAPLPRKSSALIIYEPQVDLLTQSDLWPELESQESANEQLSALDRLCDWITREGKYLDHILVLLDIHYKPGLNDSMFWKRGAANGSPKQDNESKCVEHPEVGTVISTEDILQKVWIPVVEGNQVFADEFLVDHGSQDGDISNSRQQLVIKPKHCQIGSAGAAVVDSLNTVLTTWSNTHHREVEYLVSQHRGANKSVSPNRDLVPQHNWVYDRNQIEHVASQVERVFFAGQVLGHCHSLHLVSDLAAGMVESLGVGDDKEITVLSDALLICGPTKQDREEMMDEVIVTSQLQQIIISSTQDVLLE